VADERSVRPRVEPVLVTLPDGCRLAARAFGPEDAPPVLFVAGGDGTMLQWRGLVPELCVDAAERELFAAAGCGSSLSADLRVVAYDARGSGWSSRSHGVCTTTAQAAADGLALAAALTRRPFHIVGHGLGSAVALQLALASSSLVRSLVLLAGTPGGDRLVLPGREVVAARGALSVVLDEVAEAGAVEREDLEELEALVRRDVESGFTPDFVHAHPALLGHLAAEAARHLIAEASFTSHGFSGMSAVGGRGEQFATHDLVARLGEVAVPTLVVHGKDDAILPPGNGQSLADGIPGARLVLLEAGHAVTIERAADVSAAVRAHVLLHP